MDNGYVFYYLQSELDSELGLETVIQSGQVVHSSDSLDHYLLLSVIRTLSVHNTEGGSSPGTLLNLQPQLSPRLLHLLHARLHQPQQVHCDHHLQASPVHLGPAVYKPAL